ncbi:Hpt domain-containing protein [Altererythrobacter sp. CAU 1778]
MNTLDARMAELARRFAARAGAERAGLSQALAAGDGKAVRDRAHKLAGIAAMFGYPEIGEAALALEIAAENGEDLSVAARELDDRLAELDPAD